METGTQVAYIPQHVMDSLGDNWTQHPDVEFGFVMDMLNDEIARVRYWRKGHPGDLRTVANSENTAIDNLVEYQSVDQDVVRRTIAVILDERPDLSFDYSNRPEDYPFVADDLAFDAAREDRIFGR